MHDVEKGKRGRQENQMGKDWELGRGRWRFGGDWKGDSWGRGGMGIERGNGEEKTGRDHVGKRKLK